MSSLINPGSQEFVQFLTDRHAAERTISDVSTEIGRYTTCLVDRHNSDFYEVIKDLNFAEVADQVEELHEKRLRLEASLADKTGEAQARFIGYTVSVLTLGSPLEVYDWEGLAPKAVESRATEGKIIDLDRKKYLHHVVDFSIMSPIERPFRLGLALTGRKNETPVGVRTHLFGTPLVQLNFVG